MTVKYIPAPNAQVMNVTFDPERRNFSGHHIGNDGHKILLVIRYGEGKPQFGENYEALRLLDTILHSPENEISRNFDAMTESHFRKAIDDYSMQVVELKRGFLRTIGADLESEEAKASIAQSQQSAEYVASLQSLSFDELKQILRIQQIDIVDGGYQISIGVYEPQALLIRAFLPTHSNVTSEQIDMLKAMAGDTTQCPLCAAGIPHPADFHPQTIVAPGEPAPVSAPAAAEPAAARPAGQTLH